MPNIIDVDSSEIVKFTNKLERIGKYELPVVARQTLNELAFRMKGDKGQVGEIEKEAKEQFDYSRNRTLFRAFTGVQKATGNEINSMFSQSGIIERSGREKLARNMQEHQKGGNVDSRSTPTYESRVGGQLKGKVRTKNYMKKLVPVDLTRNKGRRFAIRAYQAIKNKRAIIFSAKSGVDYVADIEKYDRNAKYKFSMTILFRLNKKRLPLKEKRPFVNNAASNLIIHGPNIFIEKVNNRIKRKFEKR